MCAFTATRHNPDLASFYARLRRSGKEHLSAVIAVARKLIILANAILIRNTEWTPQYPQK
jgi:transposase